MLTKKIYPAYQCGCGFRICLGIYHFLRPSRSIKRRSTKIECKTTTTSCIQPEIFKVLIGYLAPDLKILFFVDLRSGEGFGREASLPLQTENEYKGINISET